MAHDQRSQIGAQNKQESSHLREIPHALRWKQSFPRISTLNKHRQLLQEWANTILLMDIQKTIPVRRR